MTQLVISGAALSKGAKGSGTPIGGITPKGYRKVAEGVYVRPEAAGRGKRGRMSNAHNEALVHLLEEGETYHLPEGMRADLEHRGLVAGGKLTAEGEARASAYKGKRDARKARHKGHQAIKTWAMLSEPELKAKAEKHRRLHAQMHDHDKHTAATHHRGALIANTLLELRKVEAKVQADAKLTDYDKRHRIEAARDYAAKKIDQHHKAKYAAPDLPKSQMQQKPEIAAGDQTVPELIRLFESTIDDRGNLERGGDYYKDILSQVSTDKLLVLKDWANEHSSRMVERFLGGNISGVLRGRERAEEPKLVLPEKPKPAAPASVDRNLYITRPKFGAAGGPDEVVLTGKGEILAATRATGLRERQVRMLEDMAVSGGKGQVERVILDKRRMAPFGEAYDGHEIREMSRLGYIQRPADWQPSDPSVYVLTQKGETAVRDIRAEQKYLRDRAQRVEDEKKAPSDPGWERMPTKEEAKDLRWKVVHGRATPEEEKVYRAYQDSLTEAALEKEGRPGDETQRRLRRLWQDYRLAKEKREAGGVLGAKGQSEEEIRIGLEMDDMLAGKGSLPVSPAGVRKHLNVPETFNLGYDPKGRVKFIYRPDSPGDRLNFWRDEKTGQAVAREETLGTMGSAQGRWIPSRRKYPLQEALKRLEMGTVFWEGAENWETMPEGANAFESRHPIVYKKAPLGAIIQTEEGLYAVKREDGSWQAFNEFGTDQGELQESALKGTKLRLYKQVRSIGGVLITDELHGDTEKEVNYITEGNFGTLRPHPEKGMAQPVVDWGHGRYSQFHGGTSGLVVPHIDMPGTTPSRELSTADAKDLRRAASVHRDAEKRIETRLTAEGLEHWDKELLEKQARHHKVEADRLDKMAGGAKTHEETVQLIEENKRAAAAKEFESPEAHRVSYKGEPEGQTLTDALKQYGFTHAAHPKFPGHRDIYDPQGRVIFTGTAHETWNWLRSPESKRVRERGEPVLVLPDEKVAKLKWAKLEGDKQDVRVGDKVRRNLLSDWNEAMDRGGVFITGKFPWDSWAGLDDRSLLVQRAMRRISDNMIEVLKAKTDGDAWASRMNMRSPQDFLEFAYGDVAGVKRAFARAMEEVVAEATPEELAGVKDTDQRSEGFPHLVDVVARHREAEERGAGRERLVEIDKRLDELEEGLKAGGGDTEEYDALVDERNAIVAKDRTLQPAADRDLSKERWVTGDVPDFEADPVSKYTVMIRAKDDPERSPRSERKGQEQAWRKKLGKGTEPEWADKFREHLADGEARTFNRMLVEIADVTADMAVDKAPERALWDLVERGELEFTRHAPVLFRKTGKAAPKAEPALVLPEEKAQVSKLTPIERWKAKAAEAKAEFDQIGEAAVRGPGFTKHTKKRSEAARKRWEQAEAKVKAIEEKAKQRDINKLIREHKKLSAANYRMSQTQGGSRAARSTKAARQSQNAERMEVLRGRLEAMGHPIDMEGNLRKPEPAPDESLGKPVEQVPSERDLRAEPTGATYTFTGATGNLVTATKADDGDNWRVDLGDGEKARLHSSAGMQGFMFAGINAGNRETLRVDRPTPAPAERKPEVPGETFSERTARQQRESRREKMGPEPEGKGLVSVSGDEIPWDTARRAHSGTSWTPDERGEQERRDYVNDIRNAETRLARYATTEEKREQARGMLERYKEGYRKRLTAYLGSRSGLVSSMIAGPSNFPAERMRKKSEASDRRLHELLEWQKKVLGKMERELSGRGPIKSTDSDAVTKLKRKLERLERDQAAMKAANKVVRNKKLNREQKLAQLADLEGAEPAEVAHLLEPDFAGRLGYPSFQLTNNNAQIKRLRERIESVSKEQAVEGSEREFEGGKLVDNPDDGRVQIFFDAKPDAETRTKLKSRGFRWAPSVGAWQRQRTADAREAARVILGLEKSLEPAGLYDAHLDMEAWLEQNAGDSSL